MEKYDVIVIGSGLGGLIAAAKLSKEGKRVLVVEQHNVPGGSATTFKKGDFTMEVSLHKTDGLDEKDTKTKIFKELGVFDNLEFVKVSNFYRFVDNNTDIEVPDSVDEAIGVLSKEFPGEEKAIKKFIKKVVKIRNEVHGIPVRHSRRLLLYPIFPAVFPNFLFNMGKTLGGYLDSLTENKRLKDVLSANFAYYHDDPNKVSFTYFATGNGGYFSGGGHYIKGGSQKLSDYLAGFVEDNQGKVLLNSLVTKIIIEGGKAVGVEYKDKNSDFDEVKKVFASVVVSNANIPSVVGKMLPKEYGDKIHKKIKGFKNSPFALNIYIGFKKPIKDLGNKNYITFVFDERETFGRIEDNFENKGYSFVDYSQIDSGLAPEGKSMGVVITLDDIKNWENLSEDEYRVKKEKVAQIFFDKLEKLVPGSKDAIELYEVATPKTLQDYTLNPGGSIYGFAQTPDQVGLHRPDVKSPIKNLYFASAWAGAGGGYTGSILGGYFCADRILSEGL